MDIITYSLRNGDNDSDNYYSDIAAFTDEVLDTAGENAFLKVKPFRDFLLEKNKEKIRTAEEYFFEFLTIGVLWLLYSRGAVRLKAVPAEFLIYLVQLRQRKKVLKKYIDHIRGLLSTIFLYPGTKNVKAVAAPSLNNFSLLIKWLSASGEFKEEVKRLKLWQQYLSVLKTDEAVFVIKESVKLAQWFEERSKETLGKYTYGINIFLEDKLKSHLWKEDIIFCARSRVEYHLNMFGAEIMNRAFRKDFELTDKRAVLLPACMRALPDDECKAKREGIDYICTHCNVHCKVHQMTMLGKKENFKVFIIPHSSDFSQWLKDHGVNSGIGTVGVACINNLISGGLELKSLNIPAQCVLLDYCGCKNHWDKKGFSTGINISQRYNNKFSGKRLN